MDFFSTLSLRPPHAHLVAEGELDVFAAAELRHRLDDAVDRGCIHFTLDASAVTFVDAGGLGMLVRLSNTVAPFGGTLAAVAVSPRFRQLTELVGLAEVFGVDLLPDMPSSTDDRTVPIGNGRDRRDVCHLTVVPRGLATRRYREPVRPGGQRAASR